VEKHEIRYQGSRCPGRASNRTPPEFKSEALLLEAACLAAVWQHFL
jgi:hypothetical protein